MWSNVNYNHNAWPDNHQGEHCGIEEIMLNGNCYYVEVGDVRGKRCLGRDVEHRALGRDDMQPHLGIVGRDAKSFGGKGGDGPHLRPSCHT